MWQTPAHENKRQNVLEFSDFMQISRRINALLAMSHCAACIVTCLMMIHRCEELQCIIRHITKTQEWFTVGSDFFCFCFWKLEDWKGSL